MSSILSSIFSSKGIKRYLAAILDAISVVALTIPQLAFLTPWLEKAAALLGLAGVGHATAAKNIKFDAKSIASVIAILLAIAQQVPQFSGFVPLLMTLAAIFGGATVAKGLTIKK